MTDTAPAIMQDVVRRYVQAECFTQGGLSAGIIAIESRLRSHIWENQSHLHIDVINRRRLQIVINVCRGDGVILQRIAFLRRFIHADKRATYLRTNCRDGYFDFTPTPITRSKRS
jgi:hypothetical protein